MSDNKEIKKLKTLDDCYEWTDEDYEQLSYKRLQDAAREWIKHLEDTMNGHQKVLMESLKGNVIDFPDGYLSILSEGYTEIVRWIRHFFNLSDEEELK